MDVKQLLLQLPQAVDLDPSAPDAVIQYDMTQPVYHVIKAGTVQAHEGRAPSADVTIKINDDNLLKLLQGELKPMTAMMTGRLKVRGNVMLAQRLIGMVNREKLEAARARIVADQRA